MKKARYNEVPKEYRRNHKKELAEFLKMFALCGVFVLFLVWMLWMS